MTIAPDVATVTGLDLSGKRALLEQSGPLSYAACIVATGVRFRDLPFTPERIYGRLQSGRRLIPSK